MKTDIEITNQVKKTIEEALESARLYWNFNQGVTGGQLSDKEKEELDKIVAEFYDRSFKRSRDRIRT